ncbi:MAG: hypothetical protein HQL55_19960 [Magnetococcales bacterium]|nr:hypothetical protein [Magnetococcales bacterium]
MFTFSSFFAKAREKLKFDFLAQKVHGRASGVDYLSVASIDVLYGAIVRSYLDRKKPVVALLAIYTIPHLLHSPSPILIQDHSSQLCLLDKFSAFAWGGCHHTRLGYTSTFPVCQFGRLDSIQNNERNTHAKES